MDTIATGETNEHGEEYFLITEHEIIDDKILTVKTRQLDESLKKSQDLSAKERFFNSKTTIIEYSEDKHNYEISISGDSRREFISIKVDGDPIPKFVVDFTPYNSIKNVFGK